MDQPWFESTDGTLVAEASALGWRSFPAQFELEWAGRLLLRRAGADRQEEDLLGVRYRQVGGAARALVIND